MDFGVFYTCFTEKNAVDYSIEVLKNIYPSIPIYLVSDGGLDYSFLKDKYSNIETKLEYDSRGFIPSIGNDFKEENIQSKIKDSILTFLDRINRGIDYCDKEYLLIMESDVLVRGRLNNPENKKLLGSRINSGLSDELKNILSNYKTGISINNWGAVPAIFNCNTFKLAYNNLLNDDKLFNELCMSDSRLSNYDVLLPVLFATIGIEESFNSEIIECFRNSNWENTIHPLVHQYRAKYPLSTDGYIGTHIINNNGLKDRWDWKR